MAHKDKLIIKKYQIALRRLLKGTKVSNNHYIHKYVDKQLLIKRINHYLLDGMNWDNYGKVWELSHIVPVNYFDHTNEEHLKLCWNHKNLIPMYKQDNKDIGSCILFAKEWFNNRSDEDYTKYNSFIINKISCLSKYLV